MNDATPQAPLRTGRTYELLEVLGIGAFGKVYRARQVGEFGFTREVAVKVSTDGQSRSTSRLREEARILSFVHHRSIVHIDDLIEIDGAPGLVMELIDGLDLARVFAYTTMPVGPAAEIVLEIAGALDCAQRARGPGGHPLLLQHRDLKPANIMITVNGETKLLDFGVAQANLVDEDRPRSMSFGSRGYIAPERLRGAPHPNSDIYALGVVFFEILAGQRFGSPPLDHQNHGIWCKRALRALPVGLPPAGQRLLVEMLAWAPDERPTAREVERRAAAITRSATMTLRDWAEDTLPELRLGLAASSGVEVPSEVSTVDPPFTPDTGESPVGSRPEAGPSSDAAGGRSGRKSLPSPLLFGILFVWAVCALVLIYFTAGTDLVRREPASIEQGASP